MSNLHYSVLQFFEKKMGEHNCVSAFTRTDSENDVVYKINRTNGRNSIKVFLTDAYEFGQADYLGRPRTIKKGDFILIARPESRFDGDAATLAKNDGIGIGKIGKLMGALNLDDVSSYRTPEEKEAEARKKRF